MGYIKLFKAKQDQIETDTREIIESGLVGALIVMENPIVLINNHIV